MVAIGLVFDCLVFLGVVLECFRFACFDLCLWFVLVTLDLFVLVEGLVVYVGYECLCGLVCFAVVLVCFVVWIAV